MSKTDTALAIGILAAIAAGGYFLYKKWGDLLKWGDLSGSGGVGSGYAEGVEAERERWQSMFPSQTKWGTIVYAQDPRYVFSIAPKAAPAVDKIPSPLTSSYVIQTYLAQNKLATILEKATGMPKEQRTTKIGVLAEVILRRKANQFFYSPAGRIAKALIRARLKGINLK